jgi:hypothetical protein
MSAAQAIPTDVFEDRHVHHCLLCRRVRWSHGQQDGPAEWEELTGFLTRNRLALSSLVVVDAYCETCETFYRQLLTYGRPGQQITASTINSQITA